MARIISAEKSKKNVFVMGLDPFNRRLLERLPQADSCRFLPVLDPARVVRADAFDLPALLDEARRVLREGEPDALVGYWDFPTTLMLPILRREMGLPGATLESALRCEHKYWSRLCQREVAPEAIPQFQVVDPFETAGPADVEIPYPFWIKPIKSHSSYLGFAVYGPADLQHALSVIREDIGRFAAPFAHILEQADLPEEVRLVPEHGCIAERMIATNWQCTLEGWVRGGHVQVYGIVDSIREGAVHSSFSRYQYPSSLPEDAQQRMIDVVKPLVTHLELDDSPFNVEFFYDEVEDRIWLLEINARVSKSHSPLFERVDGASNLLVMVAIGLDEEPHMPSGAGEFEVAAKFMVRVHHDGVVTRAPTDTEVAHVRHGIPGVDVQILVREGLRLSDLPNQDSYSYEVADLYIGGRDERELLDKYHRSLQMLPFDIEPDVPGPSVAGTEGHP